MEMCIRDRGKPEQSITTQIKDTEKQKKIRRAVFLVYLAVTIKLIIFKYPWEHLKEIMDTWEKGIILEGLETANFTLFKTVPLEQLKKEGREVKAMTSSDYTASSWTTVESVPNNNRAGDGHHTPSPFFIPQYLWQRLKRPFPKQMPPNRMRR